MIKEHKDFRFFMALMSTIFALLLIVPSQIQGQSPTVNGLFYGDGDYQRYNLWAVSPDANGTLYYYIEGETLYIATVANYGTVADNVIGDDGNSEDEDYLLSSGWPSGHTAGELIGSDKLSMTFRVGSSEWSWDQDYIYDLDGDEDPSRSRLGI